MSHLILCQVCLKHEYDTDSMLWCSDDCAHKLAKFFYNWYSRKQFRLFSDLITHVSIHGHFDQTAQSVYKLYHEYIGNDESLETKILKNDIKIHEQPLFRCCDECGHHYDYKSYYLETKENSVGNKWYCLRCIK